MHSEAAPPPVGALAGEPSPARGGFGFHALVLATQLPASLAFTVPIPILATMAASLGHSAGQAFEVKLIMGVLGPSMALGALCTGWLAGRCDRRSLLLVLALLASLAGLAPAVLENLPAIIATRAATGFAVAGLMTLGLTMVGDYCAPEARTRLFGLLGATSMVASVISLPLSGFIGDHGWRHSFVLYLLPLILVPLALPQRIPAPAVVAKVAVAAPRRGLFGLPLGFLLLALAIGLILSIPGIYLSFHLATLGVHKASAIGTLMMATTILSTVVSVLYGAAFARLGLRRTFIVAFAGMGAALWLLAFAPSFAIAATGQLLVGFGMSWLTPNLMNALSLEVDEADRGRCVGIVQSAMMIAPLVGVLLLEPLLPHWGTAGVLSLTGLLSLALAALYLTVRRAPGCAIGQ
jgi:MFS family permease